ncbi:MAG: type I-E CRISPR-associated protein Cas6/Cse3/CasE [Acidimicrobiia bacterium]|nr:type I-E CRISPR-associated protein Cas6/Cse3/CasE [Acidimicrobiia bacterium]
MTTLSMLTLNPKSQQCRNDMRNLQSIHRRIMGLFPHTPAAQARQEFGVLWRVEPKESPTLLLQSSMEPDFSSLPERYASYEHKNIDNHLESLRNGQIVRYRVMVNPVRSSRARGRNDQTPIPFAQHSEWWDSRSRRIGLLSLDTPMLIGQPAKRLRRNSVDPSLPIYSTRVDGIAEIADADILRLAIESGVGRAKAWGCGLLTVAKAR